MTSETAELGEGRVPEAARPPDATDEQFARIRGLTSLIDTLTDHFLLLIGSGMLVIKLLTIAEYSTSTALTIIQSAGITSTLLGVVLPIFPWLVGLLGLFVVIRNAGSTGARRVFVPLFLALVLAALLPATVVGWMLLGATIFVPVIRASPQGLRWANARITRLAASAVLAAAAVVLVSAIALDRSMWLPAERVEISTAARSGTEVNWIAVGYVLGSNSDWTVILTDSPRAVLRVRTHDVTSRGPCRVDVEERSNSILRAIVNAMSGDRLAVSVPPPCPSAFD